MTPPPDVRWGTCAWTFDDWEGVFYPRGLPPAERLAFYARYFRSVEIDSTFYHVPAEGAVRRWHDAVPEDFLFCCKLPRLITHERRLTDCREELVAFARAISGLGEKLGVVLVQLPPGFRLPEHEPALRHFLPLLPREMRFAVEFRQRGLHSAHVAHLLEKHRVCWAWTDADPAEGNPRAPFEFLPVTTDLLYLRLMGDRGTKYSPDGTHRHQYGRELWSKEKAVVDWAEKIAVHRGEVGRVFLFANNHYEGYSPLTCQRVAAAFGSKQTLPEPRAEDAGQLELF